MFFDFYKKAQYATDLIIYQSSLPAETVSKIKTYYSGKQSLYEYETEVSILSNSHATGCNDNYEGSTADITIFRENISWSKKNICRINAEGKALTG